MNEKTDNYAPSERVVPISKAVADAFYKTGCFYYANHDNGSLYISNGYFIMKADKAEFDGMMEQINKRYKSKFLPVEKTAMLKYIDGERGKYELTGEPLDFESGEKKFISLFADEKQYFGYDKKYVDVFNNGDNRLFVDDNAGYDINTHQMIVKNPGGEVLGVVLPLRLGEEIYKNLEKVMPLQVKWKNEYERIKENPTKDPYIGKEFFDGRDTHIIASVKEVNGLNHYTVPNVKDGRVSGYADYVKVDEIESYIARWEENRVMREKDKPKVPAEKEAPPAPEKKPLARPFTHFKNSPWGEVTASDKLCPGVYSVKTEKQSGIMVEKDMTAALSPAALKCGARWGGFVCFGDDGAKDVALRELLDKKLLTVSGNAEKKINANLREKQPQYWRSQENRRTQKKPERSAPVSANESR